MLIRKITGAVAACTAVAALALAGAGTASAVPASVTGGRAVAPTGTPPTTSGLTATTASTSAGALAAGCWYSSSHWWCNNVSGAPVYASGTTTVVGYMYSNPSWFVCRSDNGGYVGGPHPYRWEWTQADNGAWGWMKDTAIYSETDPLPVC
ncbi:hypothetical protein [Streptomyces sp. MBT53]|uniref:hypothetical protein n=1 Tax=Streptomyces sp. MBT53 TaxID=1488384 RepID=UPI001F1DFA95|nr:hypothetical protein [Streptomyces sp. MBT53]